VDPVARINNITFACENPVELSEFWGAATGYVPIDVPAEVQESVDRLVAEGKLDPTGWAMLVPADGGAGPKLLFQRRTKTPTESIPIHLDLAADDREAEVERLSSLGASVVETKSNEFGETWTVMRDPEGNGFCVSGGGDG
jgi:poly(3-hydroxybutyrate) depolymerase